MDAERRQVTVLFTDMVGFTSFSEQSGEERAFNLMQSLAQLMGDAVHDQGGVVQGFTGDGIMAVFGAPVAFEDAPLRACKAALAIHQRLDAAASEIEAQHGVRPQLRIGMNTGPAVVGQVQSGASVGVTVLGDTVNFAARLQALAQPRSIVMSEMMHSLVSGAVESRCVGEHEFKGKVGKHKVYRLEAVRQGVTRFQVAVGRGLSAYVGREHEIKILERGLDAIASDIAVVDIVGEPGIGKSRLLHEFSKQIVKDRARVLMGSCTPDGQQTPYLPVIEIVRGALHVSAGDEDVSVRRNVEDGLDGLGLHSIENLGLLLHLFGLKVPDGALTGLDGVLIGLRTNDLVQRIVQAISKLTPLVLVVEDLHWIDSASEDLLAKIVAAEEPQRLLLLHTFRPEYRPPWSANRRVMALPLRPLEAQDTLRILEARLGVGKLPEALAKLIAARTEGNALFAEEIGRDLLERGIVRRGEAGLEFDATLVGAALPRSVQSLLASRVDRLAPLDRALLQAAAVIGRRFDSDLLPAVVVEVSDIQGRLNAMETLDLVRREGEVGAYVFKHALVRDALYDGLLSAPRSALHLKIAGEMERRGGNRLIEIAEALAHHYAQTTRADKAFTYLALAGDKSIDIYSIQEAQQYYRKALELYEAQNECAGQLAVVRVVVRLLETLILQNHYGETGRVAQKFITLVKNAGETTELVMAYYCQAQSLISNFEIRAAHDLLLEALAIAERLGDGRARAYARGCLLQTRILLGLDSLEIADQAKRQLMEDGQRFGDNFIRNWSFWFVAWDYFYRGLSKQAREVAVQLIESGNERNDPRALGLANWLLGWIDIGDDRYDDAISHAEECLRVAVTPTDRQNGEIIKAGAGLFNGRVQEGLLQLNALVEELERLGAKYNGASTMRGVAIVLAGRLSEGIRAIRQRIAQLDAAGDRGNATWTRVILAEIYIQILSGKQKPPALVILKNIWTIGNVLLFGHRRATALLAEAATYKQMNGQGTFFARIEFDLGLLSAMKKNRDRARTHFDNARIAAIDQDADMMVKKIDAAISELG